MLNQIRAQLRLFFDLLEGNKTATATVVRRDVGVLHDDLLKAECYLVTVPIEVLHEYRESFSKLPKEVSEALEKAIEAVDKARSENKLPPSAGFSRQSELPLDNVVPIK